jgi:hypothetical protein
MLDRLRKMGCEKMTQHNIGEIVWLDLDEVELIGWEEIKDVAEIARFVRKIDAGKDFPPVFVAQVGEKYVLSCYSEFRYCANENYGGHHRALAYYIAGKPLKCQITKDCRNERVISREFDIKKTLLVSKRNRAENISLEDFKRILEEK